MMTTTKRRRERQELSPDLGVLATQLTFSLQEEFFARLAVAGYDDLHPRHWAVLAYLDEDGVRATELARLSGRHKQIVGRLVDELEELGYVVRRPDPSDRRAKLITLTPRGRECISAGLATIDGLEERISSVLGERGHRQLRTMLTKLLDAD